MLNFERASQAVIHPALKSTKEATLFPEIIGFNPVATHNLL